MDRTCAASAAQVSLLMPARNAARTVARAVESVLQQSFVDWELLIGVGPSSDRTEELVQALAARDQRIRISSNQDRTAGCARNGLLQHARGRHVLFFDADDTIGRDHLSALAARARHEGADITMTGFRRRLPDGHVLTRRAPPNPVTSCRNPFANGMVTALHAILFSQDILRRISGFSPDLVTNEDWDLCWRAAEAGARVATFEGYSADYWVNPGSLSSDVRRMLTDRMEVRRRILMQVQPGAAPRAKSPDEHRDDIRTALWAGARSLAQGGDAGKLLESLEAFPAPLTDPDDGAAALLEGLALGFACTFDQIPRRYPQLAERLGGFLAALAERSGDRGLDIALRRQLEKELARLSDPWHDGVLGKTYVLSLPKALLGRIDPPEGVTEVALRVPRARPRSHFTFHADAAHAAGRPAWALAADRVRARRAARNTADRPVPVLMYHGVSASGPASLAAWRVTPAQFAEQMRYLVDHGFGSISPQVLRRAEAGGTALPARPIIITFDDGLADFAANAWPILRDHGLGAHLFIVAGKIGTTASWDAAYGPASELMDAATIKRVVREGATLGSHMMTHTNLFRLTGAEVVEEARQAAERLSALAGEPVTTVAPPYGAFDERIADLLQEAGYEQIFGIRHAVASFSSPSRDIPRIEVSGRHSLEDFAQLLGPAV